MAGTRTLSIDESSLAEPRRTDHLYVALSGGKPIGGARYALDGIDRIEIGRGAARAAKRDGKTLKIEVPDPWMSSAHLRFERERAHWLAVDAGSRNGILVNGAKQDRTVVAAHDIVEAGRSFCLLRTSEPAAERDVDVVPKTTGTLATLDPVLAAAFAELRAVAPSRIPVLIGGPTGAGKERVARTLHAASGRHGAFVPVNCGALPENLVESELFGYKKGAFSGAQADHPGLVKTADGGTLFLDEIGDLPASSQAALLRVLQEKEVMPVGGTKAVPVDLRVVAATHRDLDDMVADQAFRHDLFARLAGFRIQVPPLADRRCDLGILIGALHTRLFPAEHPGFDIDAARLLLRYPWPLNVRELEQALGTAQVLAGAEPVRAEHLPDTVRSGRPPGAPRPIVLSESDQKVRDQVVAALREHQGNVSAVARALDKDRKQIQRWIKRFGLDPASYR